jgi:hypothetical protein
MRVPGVRIMVWQLFHFILGPVLIITGGYFLLISFGMATLVDPGLEGWEWWIAYLGNLLPGAILPILGGLWFIALGLRSIYLAMFREPEESKGKGRPGPDGCAIGEV